MAPEVQAIKAELAASEARNRRQAARIARLEADLQARAIPAMGDLLVAQGVRPDLGAAAGVELLSDRVRIATDPVFLPGSGELSAAGRMRLTPVADALVAAVATLPADRGWRVRVSGHTDRRPIRTLEQFATNWELSAARATALVRLLTSRGLPAEQVEAVARAATQQLDPGDTAAAHRRNRRVEISLQAND